MANFIKNGNNIIPFPKGFEYELEAGKVYDLLIKTVWGERVTKFTLNGEMNLPQTVYQTKKDKLFVDRVLKNFFSSEKNTTGVLLTGDKGTGKSVTAKVLAEKANLPIIVINPEIEEKYLEEFFKEFSQPVCILFDEVDKYFDTRKMLTFLDGMHKTAKKLVIMTANDEDNLSNFIKNRCSRVRYYRHYSMIEDAKEYAELICEAKNIKNKEEVINFIVQNIKYPSIDNISSFIDEIIFTEEWGLTLKEVLEFMNINVGESSYTEDKDYDDSDGTEIHGEDEDGNYVIA